MKNWEHRPLRYEALDKNGKRIWHKRCAYINEIVEEVAASLGYDNWEELCESNYSRHSGENQTTIRLFVPQTEEETHWGRGNL